MPTVKEQLTTCQAKVATLTKQLDACKAQNTALLADKAALVKQVETMNEELATAEADIGELTQQLDDRQARVDTLEKQVTQLQADYAKLQAEYDAYKRAHPDIPVPPAIKTLLGTSLNGPAFKAAKDGGLGYTKTDVARVYLRQLPRGSTWDNILNDGTATSDLKDAVAKATQIIWLSCKETDPALVDAFLRTKPTTVRQDIWWTHHHEPEDEAPPNGTYTPQQFVAEQKVMSPIVRKYGAVFATILMRYTFGAGSGRNWQDWFPPDLAPYVDVFGCDSYNTANKKGQYSTPDDQVKPIKAAADARHLPWAIGETGAGIFGDPSNRAQWAAALAAAGKAAGALALCWWDQDSYAFDKPTATAWLGS
jgi:hypothetical protein